MTNEEKIERLRAMLHVILDQVDYRAGNCRVNEMVGAALEGSTIERARKLLEDTKP